MTKRRYDFLVGFAFGALAGIVLTVLVGCGGTTTKTVRVAPPGAIPTTKIKLGPQSGARPDGYTPEAPPSKPTLTGNAIKLSHHGAQFIEGFEGFSSCPYWDAYGGVWTRGYGETEGIGGGSACISRRFAERNLTYRAERFYGFAIKRLRTSFNQNEVDALYSFLWNLGAGIMPPGSSLAHSIQRHNPSPLLAYTRAGGQVLAGLVRRRYAEVRLFRTPAHEETPAHRKARLRRERTARLHRDYRARQALRSVIASHRCSKGYRHLSREERRRCTVWRVKGARVNRDIARLHHLGV